MKTTTTQHLTGTTLIAAMIMMLVLAFTTAAQSNTISQYDRGTPPPHTAGVSPFNSYLSADLGVINLSNGALNIRLPLGEIGGRGFSVPINLNYSSKVWSGSRGTITVPPNQQAPVAYAKYDDLANSTDIYNKLAAGWTIGAAPFLKVRGQGINSVNNPVNGCTDFTWVVVKLTLALPDKGEIEFRDDAFEGAPAAAQIFAGTGCRTQDANRGNRWHATDGSGAIFINEVANGVVNGNVAGKVITADGMIYHFVNTGAGNLGGSANVNAIGRCDWIQDRNGNKITIAYPNASTVEYTDQLGRTTTVQFFQTTSPGLALRVTVPGYNNTSRIYEAYTGVMNQHYRTGIAPALPVYNGDFPDNSGLGTALFFGSHLVAYDQLDNKTVLTEVRLPDARSVSFKYNEFGEVAEVQLPTGGKMQYDYQGMTVNTGTGQGLPSGNSLVAEVNAPPGSGAGGNVAAVDRAIVERRTYPDGNTSNPPEGRWMYTYRAQASGGGTSSGSTEVKCFSATNALLLHQKHSFMAASRYLSGSTSTGVDGTGYSLWSTGLQTRTDTFDSNGVTVLAASEQDWEKKSTVSWTTGYPSQDIANHNRVKESRKILDNGSIAKTKTFYANDGDVYTNNANRVEEFDFGATTPKRYSTTLYETSSAYLNDNVHLLSLPLQQSVFDGSSNQEKARTVYEYDNYTNDGNNLPLQGYGNSSSIPGRTASYNDPNNLSTQKRGNMTRVTKYIDVNAGTTITAYSRYDIIGNVVSLKDPKAKVSTLSYVDDFGLGASPGTGSSGTYGPTYALPTYLESPPPNAGEAAHTARSQYDFSTGLLTGFKDRNGIIAQTLYNDAFHRPTQIKAALGTALQQHTQMFYAPTTIYGVNLAANDMLTATDQVSLNDANLRSWTKTDGFGRTIEAWQRDMQGDVKALTAYDGMGRTAQVSNPLRSGDTAYYTTTSYDLAGRVRQLTTPDNAVVQTMYVGNATTVTDQAGKQRRSVSDGLGRLMRLDEPDASGNLGLVTSPAQPTSYTYDALDNLARVQQGSQNRYFFYDSLKRLLRSYNPEQNVNAALTLTDPLTGNSQWNSSYSYDNNSNLTQKVDARNLSISYSYDALNRATFRDYSDTTPDVTYTYDAANYSKGRLTQVSSSASTYQYTIFDALGRVRQSQQITAGNTYQMNYVYNLSGAMTKEVYPSGREVNTSYDVAGRITGLTGYKLNEGNRTYASGMSYTAHGAIQEMTLGNNLIKRSLYNSRLQPTQIKLGDIIGRTHLNS